MPGPGEYRPDPTEGITRIEDLPKAQHQLPEPELPAPALPSLWPQLLPRSPSPPHPP